MNDQDKREKVIKGLEMSYRHSCVDEGNVLIPQALVLETVALLKAQEPVENDQQFLTHIISEICDYATAHEMESDETLETVADNIKALLEISTFNGWKGR